MLDRVLRRAAAALVAGVALVLVPMTTTSAQAEVVTVQDRSGVLKDSDTQRLPGVPGGFYQTYFTDNWRLQTGEALVARFTGFSAGQIGAERSISADLKLTDSWVVRGTNITECTLGTGGAECKIQFGQASGAIVSTVKNRSSITHRWSGETVEALLIQGFRHTTQLEFQYGGGTYRSTSFAAASI